MWCKYCVIIGLLAVLLSRTDSWSFKQQWQSSCKHLLQLQQPQQQSCIPHHARVEVKNNKISIPEGSKSLKRSLIAAGLLSWTLSTSVLLPSVAVEDAAIVTSSTSAPAAMQQEAASEDINSATNSRKASFNVDNFKVPYFHNNYPIRQFLGSKATIVFNMKIDDPQTSQFPEIVDVAKKYKADGLNVLAFPSDQGWFEPDDDETVRIKAKEFYGFGDYPADVVFDKVDYLGPSANPFIEAITNALPTPNGYSRITLNYEKFLLDENGFPVRRYPRKYSMYDMEGDIQAMLNGQPLPEPTAKYQRMWREAKREAVKSEYAFRYNYDYYDAPNSMYKYNPDNDIAQ